MKSKTSALAWCLRSPRVQRPVLVFLIGLAMCLVAVVAPKSSFAHDVPEYKGEPTVNVVSAQTTVHGSGSFQKFSATFTVSMSDDINKQEFLYVKDHSEIQVYIDNRPISDFSVDSVAREPGGCLIVFVLNTSSAAAGAPFELMLKAVGHAVAMLDDKDQYVVITYSDAFSVAQAKTSDKVAWKNVAPALVPRGLGTKLEQAVREAIRIAGPGKGSVRVIVFTDSRASQAVDPDKADTDSAIFQAGPPVDVIALEPTLNLDRMLGIKRISRSSGGAFRHLRDPAEIPSAVEASVNSALQSIPVRMTVSGLIPDAFADGNQHMLAVGVSARGKQSKFSAAQIQPQKLARTSPRAEEGPNSSGGRGGADVVTDSQSARSSASDDVGPGSPDVVRQMHVPTDADNLSASLARAEAARQERATAMALRREEHDKLVLWLIVLSSIIAAFVLGLIIRLLVLRHRRLRAARTCVDCGELQPLPTQRCGKCLALAQDKAHQEVLHSSETPRQPQVPVAESSSSRKVYCKLLALVGPLKGREFAITERKVRLGRDPVFCGVIFPEEDHGISRQHAEVFWHAGSWHIRNLSRGGTTVNGRPVDEYAIKTDDEIEMGNSIFRFVCM